MLICCASLAIQIAKLAGFSPIIATASLRNTPLLQSLGATHVVDRNLSPAEILASLATLTEGKPLEFVYDAISLPDTQPLAYEALSPGGRLVITLHDCIPAALKKEDDGKTIAHAFGNVNAPPNRACGEAMFTQLGGWLAKGDIKVRVFGQMSPSGRNRVLIFSLR